MLVAVKQEPQDRRVVVFGGRDFTDRTWLFEVLDGQHRSWPFSCLIHGGARGADALAGLWAEERQVPVREVKADWNKHGRAAGPLRNQRMIDEERPTFAIGFPGGRGSADMLAKVKAAGIGYMTVSRF